MKTYTKEQREEWDKVTEPGLYSVIGDAAYQYLCHRIKWMLLDRGDPKTIVLIGTDDERERFIKVLIEEGVIEFGEFHPWLFFYNDYLPEGEIKDEYGYYPRSTASEVDTEDFCNFIRHSRTKGFWPVGAVVILNENCGDEKSQKYLDRLLKIPVWRGSTLEKNIELPVFNVNDAEWSDFSKPSNSISPSGLKRTVEVSWGDEMVPERVEFLVPDFIPLHQATAFSGEMDTRKSTLALDIAAAGSLFRPWFMGTENEYKPFSTLVAADEDTYTTTVLPRFVAAGGNPACLGCLNLEVKSEQQTKEGLQVYSTPLNFDDHMNELSQAILTANKTRPFKVGLLINDPIISFFGNKNYNTGQDTRDIMRGLKKLCEELQITIINICHFNKTAGQTAKQKTAGSKALIEAHRQAWAFDLMEDDKKVTLIAPIKHNLLKDGRSYKITTDSKTIEWKRDGVVESADLGIIRFVGYSAMTADDRIEEKEDKGRGGRKELKKAILDVLKDGPMPAGQVYNELRDAASLSSLKRATASLQEEGKLRRTGTNPKNFVWELATEAEQATFDEVTNNAGV